MSVPDASPNSLRDTSTQPPSANWYAVYTRASHEKQVAKHFALRQIENYLPQYQVVHRWKNRCTKTLTLPLFPGYLFARVALTDRVRVLSTPSVISLVGAPSAPTPLSDSEIDTLRMGLDQRQAEPHPFLKAGQRVRIRCGPLAGHEGFVLRTKNCLRMVISLDLIMRSVSVEVDWDELEPISTTSVLR